MSMPSSTRAGDDGRDGLCLVSAIPAVSSRKTGGAVPPSQA